jgi:hypothetical protein
MMSAALQLIQEKVQRLSPQKQAEVVDFVEFLLSRERSQPQHSPAFDWVDGPDDEPEPRTSVELQHMATQWRIEDELDLK